MIEIFAEAPLPFQYTHIPCENDPPIVRNSKVKYYVNRVITQLSRDAFKRSGFSPTDDKKKFNVMRGRQLEIEQYSGISSWQKINHYAGAYLIGRKDHFHRIMMGLKRKENKFAKFYPSSYLLPEDSSELAKNWKKKKLWIKKPAASSRGRGIKLLSSANTKAPKNGGLVQRYITNPYLITGRKFDIRLYAVVTSVDPLRIYMHENGMVRFATAEYQKTDITDIHSHLTNFSLNKSDSRFIRSYGEDESVENSKWSLKFFLNYLQDHGIDSTKVLQKLQFVVAATLTVGMNAVKEKHLQYVFHKYNAGELYGLDVMLDENLDAHIIEVNISPSLNGTDSKLDYSLKMPVMLDTLRIFCIIDTPPDSPTPLVEALEKACRASVDRERRLAVEGGEKPFENPRFADIQNVRDLLEEDNRSGGFYRVFPNKETISELLPAVGKPNYSDSVQFSFVLMSEEEQREALKRAMPMYKATLKSLAK